MALARLAAIHGEKTGAEIVAFTVDHRLRAQSASEAAQTGAWCKAMGLSHQTLVWQGDKPAIGVQEAARRARYRILAAACAEAGLKALLTAHSADDQAETVFMRLARGAGPAGLAAMDEDIRIAAGAAVPVRLLRPLLAYSRAQLTATVKSFDQPFVDDPGNDDPAYERIRTRLLLASLEEQGSLSREALLRTASRQRGSLRRLRDQEEALFREMAGCFYRWGGAALDRRAVVARSSSIGGSGGGSGGAMGGLCRRLMHAVSGEIYAPDEDAAGAALAAVLATGAATAGGALIKNWKDRLWFLREPAAVLGRAGAPAIAPAALESRKAALWDNRFILAAESAGSDVVVKPLGGADPGLFEAKKALFSGPKEGLYASPGIFSPGVSREEMLITAPALLSGRKGGITAVALAEERFRGAIIRF